MSPNRLLLQFALRRPLWIGLTIVLGFSGALFNGVSMMLIIPVVLGLLGEEVNLKGAPPILQKVFSSMAASGGESQFLSMLGLILLAILLKNVTSYVSTLSSGHLSRSLVSDIRKEGLRLLLDVDFDFYIKTKVGDLINRLGGEIGSTATAIRTAVQMLSMVITIFVFLIILVSISWQLTVISTVLLAAVSLSNSFFVKRAKRFGQQLSDQSRDYSIAVLEMLSGIRLVKATGSESYEYQKIERLIDYREKADFSSQANSALIPPLNEMAGITIVIAILLLGRIFFRGELESLSAVLLTYLLVLFRMLPFVGQLNNARSSFANLAPSVSVVNDFLRREGKPFMSKGHIPYTGMTAGIRFEQLAFTYPGHDRQVLNQVDLWLPKGTTLALVGSSGAGKSTLADLLPRFYDPTAGRILIDDRDLKDFEIRSLRQAMGIVSQDTFLFNDSVRNNLAYARKDATDEQIIEAAKRANAYEFIIKLPQGFDTLIGDRGVMLSGGQRQRLAIARALLRDPEILILDEATSALDTVSERLVQSAIDELSRDRTTLVIAHRLSTVQKADQIAVLDKGCVVEVGTHAELLKQGGLYAQLHAMQFSEEAQTV
ncbi:ABC transporter ATP-binding protein [Leptolyngbya sp. FACHB-17]|uniref:ABC transporter ATP-binding protein n=1 Tax=unclassified Leptolyngbya TaxID=2650499 RepID=UPI0016808DC9|nr:ABC transporter ATP-binding protein [Leptolyngbya sp. FACHB-17]MBD2082028.1 ABC transporter ATP-binding protein [Leptolyngbya sp. FACHB-17]